MIIFLLKIKPHQKFIKKTLSLTTIKYQPLSRECLPNVFALDQSPNFYTFMEPRNRFQGINSASLCSLKGRYDNPIPTRFLAPIDCLKIQAQHPLAAAFCKIWLFIAGSQLSLSRLGMGEGGNSCHFRPGKWKHFPAFFILIFILAHPFLIENEPVAQVAVTQHAPRHHQVRPGEPSRPA